MKPLLLFTLALVGAAAQDSDEKPPIKGDITIEKAMTWLYGEYDGKKKVSTRDGSVITALTTQSGQIQGKPYWFLYTSATEEGKTCHACQASLGFEAFAREEEGWVKVASGGSESTGGYGQVGGFKTLQLGPEVFGLVLDDGYFGQGVAYEHQSLMGFNGESFKSYFSMSTGFNNEGSLASKWDKFHWEIEWSFLRTVSNGLYDINVKWKSVPKDLAAKYARTKDGGTPPAAGIYRYNGGSYRHEKTGATLNSQQQ